MVFAESIKGVHFLFEDLDLDHQLCPGLFSTVSRFLLNSVVFASQILEHDHLCAELGCEFLD